MSIHPQASDPMAPAEQDPPRQTRPAEQQPPRLARPADESRPKPAGEAEQGPPQPAREAEQGPPQQGLRGERSPRRLIRPGVRTVGEFVTFRFDGKIIPARRGETIAAALTANGVSAMRQSGLTAESGNQPDRGLYCGMGSCFDCAVTIDGRMAQRACMTKVEGGETVRSVPPTGQGADTLGGLAVLPEKPLVEIETDILVVGAGPAGLAAALAGRRCGASVILVDERSQSGGQYYKPIAEAHTADRPPDQQFAGGDALRKAVIEAGVDVRQGVTVHGGFSPGEIVVSQDRVAKVMRPRRLILATGAYERAVPIPGWTLPGVMTTGAAQTLVRSYQVSPGDRIVIAGNGPLNFQLAADLVELGIKIEAVVESAVRPGLGEVWPALRAFGMDRRSMFMGLSYIKRLKKAGVPILWSHSVLSVTGRRHVEEVTLAPVDRQGAADTTTTSTLDCDCLCLGYGFVSATELANALGCRMHVDSRHLGTLAIDCAENGKTSLDGVYAVGDGALVRGAACAEAAGALAGASAAVELGFTADAQITIDNAKKGVARGRRFQDALWTLFQAPPVRLDLVADDVILCRCEGLTFGDVRTRIADCAQSLAVLKRQARLGMGRCQGRYCSASAAGLLSIAGIAKSVNAGGFAPRFPAKPFPAAALALEKPEWGGHSRAASPNLARPVAAEAFGELSCDVAVIGAGVVGACLANDLAEQGHDVVIVDRDDANLQASGSNAGSLHVQLLSFDFGDKAEHGGGPAAATLPLGPYAVGLWKDLADACDHDFEIRITGGLMVAETPSGMAFLTEKAALERSMGIETEIIGPDELRKLAPALSKKLIGAEYVPGEGKINPLTATYSVLERAQRLGARFFNSTNVETLERAARRWTVKTGRGTIHAPKVVNAAGPWARQVGTLVGVDLPVYSAPLQMIVTERAPHLVDQLVAHADRHLSIKQLSTGGLVIGGAWTAEYREHQNMNVTRRQSIEGNLWAACQVLPQLSGLHVIRTWAGMNVNIDGAPIVGEAAGAAGFYNAVTSNGYTLAPAVSRITADLIADREPELNIRPYLLDRF